MIEVYCKHKKYASHWSHWSTIGPFINITDAIKKVELFYIIDNFEFEFEYVGQPIGDYSCLSIIYLKFWDTTLNQYIQIDSPWKLEITKKK